MNDSLRALVADANAKTMARVHEGQSVYGDIPHVPPELQNMNHPNRNPNADGATPKPAQLKSARLAARLTHEQAGSLIHERGVRWARFENGEAVMHPASWELFRLKVAQLASRPAPVVLAVTPGRHGEAPRVNETWYDKDTGCAVVVVKVEAGLVYARGPRTSIEAVGQYWHEQYQREPFAV